MTKTSTGPYWVNTDVTGESENYTIDIDNASRRMGCSSAAPAIVAGNLNHLLGRTAHVAFAMSTSQVAGTYRHPDDKNAVLPLYQFSMYDGHREATNYVAYITSMPPNPDKNWAAWTNTYISTNALGSGESINKSYVINSSTDNYYQELIIDVIELPRGAVTNANTYSDFNIYGGMRPIDIVVYAEPARTLDSTMGHGAVEPSKAKPSIPVLNDLAEDCRARLAELRENVIPPAACWAAQGNGSGFSQAGTSPGDQLGMVVSAADDQPNNRVNFLDHSVTSRNSDTPGIYVHGYRQGIGPEDTAGGTTVYYQIHALASATNADCNGVMYAETAWSNVTGEVIRPNPTWIVLDDIIINSAQDESGATEIAARTNKIDIYGSCNAGSIFVHSMSVRAKMPQSAV